MWIIRLSLLLLFPGLVSGSLNKEMNNFFNNFGASAQVNSADIYKGQKAGHLTAGGVIIRNRVINSKLFNAKLPRFDAGCGGIDIHTGGFSFINADQFVDSLKSVGAASIGYAFMLGLETVSPQIASTMKQLQSWSNDVNQFGINSCELGAQSVGAVWPQTVQAKQSLCRAIGTKDNLIHDYVAARQHCSSASGYENEQQKIRSQDEYKDLLADECNIAWEALKKQSLLSNDLELLEMFMTLTGTIIVKNGNDASEVEIHLPGIRQEGSVLDKLLRGGDLDLLSCKDKKDSRCINVFKKSHHIPIEQGWLSKTSQKLDSIHRKIIDDCELDQEEIDFLGKSSLPLYKIVNVLTAKEGKYAAESLANVADLVAMEFLLQYLNEVVNLAQEGATQILRGQYEGSTIREYLKSLEETRVLIRSYEQKSLQRSEREFYLIQKMKLIEDDLSKGLCL